MLILEPNGSIIEQCRYWRKAVLAGKDTTAQVIYVENSICKGTHKKNTHTHTHTLGGEGGGVRPSCGIFHSMELMVGMDSFQSNAQPGETRHPRQRLHQEHWQRDRGGSRGHRQQCWVGGTRSSYKYQGDDWRNVGTRDTWHHWGT